MQHSSSHVCCSMPSVTSPRNCLHAAVCMPDLVVPTMPLFQLLLGPCACRSGLDLPTLMKIRNQSLAALATTEGWDSISELELQVGCEAGVAALRCASMHSQPCSHVHTEQAVPQGRGSRQGRHLTVG